MWGRLSCVVVAAGVMVVLHAVIVNISIHEQDLRPPQPRALDALGTCLVPN